MLCLCRLHTVLVDKWQTTNNFSPTNHSRRLSSFSLCARWFPPPITCQPPLCDHIRTRRLKGKLNSSPTKLLVRRQNLRSVCRLLWIRGDAIGGRHLSLRFIGLWRRRRQRRLKHLRVAERLNLPLPIGRERWIGRELASESERARFAV